MGALKKQQHEAAARERHANPTRTAVEVARAAGYATMSAANARKLLNRPDVLARVAELDRTAAELAGIQREAVLARIDRVGRANLVDFLGEDGATLVNLKALPRELTEALSEIEWRVIGEDKAGQPIVRPRIKLHDKNQANLALLKHFGGLGDEGDSGALPRGININMLNLLAGFDEMSPLEIARRIAFAMEQGKRALTAAAPEPIAA